MAVPPCKNLQVKTFFAITHPLEVNAALGPLSKGNYEGVAHAWDELLGGNDLWEGLMADAERRDYDEIGRKLRTRFV